MRWTPSAAVLAALACIALTSNAKAATDETDAKTQRNYVSASGLAIMAGTENATRRIDDQITMSADLDATGSTGALIALGRGATTGLRAEIELGIRTSAEGRALDRFTIVDNNENPPSRLEVNEEVTIGANTTTTSVMINALYVFQFGAIRPYVGLGIGLAQHKSEIDGNRATVGSVNLDIPETSDNQTVTAYQSMVGFLYDVSQRVKLRIGYRGFATEDIKIAGLNIGHNRQAIEAGILIRF